jgi:hypothetical protein
LSDRLKTDYLLSLFLCKSGVVSNDNALALLMWESLSELIYLSRLRSFYVTDSFVLMVADLNSLDSWTDNFIILRDELFLRRFLVNFLD